MIGSPNQVVILGISVINWQTGVMNFGKERTATDNRAVTKSVRSVTSSPAQQLVKELLEDSPIMNQNTS
ncbi:hypothetical protein GN958_ATG00829 [Phytophthora infestans]|nr:hypothetical protein GN958_ATG00829 [Phytophthora infestans]